METAPFPVPAVIRITQGPLDGYVFECHHDRKGNRWWAVTCEWPEMNAELAGSPYTPCAFSFDDEALDSFTVNNALGWCYHYARTAEDPAYWIWVETHIPEEMPPNFP